MLTKAEIEAKLKNDSDWEPDSSAPEEVWDLYYEVLDTMEFDDGQVVDFDDDEDDDFDDDMDWEDM